MTASYRHIATARAVLGTVAAFALGLALGRWGATPDAELGAPAVPAVPCAPAAPEPAPRAPTPQAPSDRCRATLATLDARAAELEGQLMMAGAPISRWPAKVDPRLTEEGLRDWFAANTIEGVVVTGFDCLEYPCIVHVDMDDAVWQEEPKRRHLQLRLPEYHALKGRRLFGRLEEELGVGRKVVMYRNGRPWGLGMAYLPADAPALVQQRLQQRLSALYGRVP